MIEDGQKLLLKNNEKDAMKKFLKAIKLEPKTNRGYIGMACLYQKSERIELSAIAYSNAMKFSHVGSLLWAQAFCRAYSMYSHAEEAVQPSWMSNMNELQVMAKMAVIHDSEALYLLALAIEQHSPLYAARLYEIKAHSFSTTAAEINSLRYKAQNLRFFCGISPRAPIALSKDVTQLVQKYMQ